MNRSSKSSRASIVRNLCRSSSASSFSSTNSSTSSLKQPSHPSSSSTTSLIKSKMSSPKDLYNKIKNSGIVKITSSRISSLKVSKKICAKRCNMFIIDEYGQCSPTSSNAMSAICDSFIPSIEKKVSRRHKNRREAGRIGIQQSPSRIVHSYVPRSSESSAVLGIQKPSYHPVSPEQNNSQFFFSDNSHCTSTETQEIEIKSAPILEERKEDVVGTQELPVTVKDEPCTSSRPRLNSQASQGSMDSYNTFHTTQDEGVPRLFCAGTNGEISTTPESDASSPLAHPNTIKVFLLLLEQQHKRFEIIQIFLNMDVTLTIEDILNLIPIHATDKFLSQQCYRGMIRPVPGSKENLDLTSETFSAKEETHLMPNELIVPIPENQTGMECIRSSQVILSLPVTQKILRKLNRQKEEVTDACDEVFEDVPILDIEEMSQKRPVLDETFLSLTTLDLNDENDDSSEMFFPVLEIDLKSSTSESSDFDNDEINLNTTSFDPVSGDVDDRVEVLMPQTGVDLLLTDPLRALQELEKYIIRSLPLSNMKKRKHSSIVNSAKLIASCCAIRNLLFSFMSSSNLVMDANSSLGISGALELMIFFTVLVWVQRNSEKKCLKSQSAPRKVYLGN